MDIFSIAEWQDGRMNKRSWWGGRKESWVFGCLGCFVVCGGNLGEFGRNFGEKQLGRKRQSFSLWWFPLLRGAWQMKKQSSSWI